jgi:hypothetical protein
MFARLRRWLGDRAMRRRIAALGEAERERIIAASPYDAAAFQGEGYHVFRKDDPDYRTGYVTSLGEIDPRSAEDWIIARWLEGEDGRAGDTTAAGRPLP